MGFGGRVKGSIIGVFFGVLLVPGSIALHAWNEYRTIHRTRGLKEAAELVVTIPDAKEPAPIEDGSLVHLAGFADTEEFLEDREFAIRANAIHLARRVEMYQWTEDEHENSEGHKSYSYDMRWHSGRVDSGSFHESGHNNPPLKFHHKQSSADKVQVGLYRLNNALKDSIDTWSPITVNEATVFESIGREHPEQFRLYENQIYWSQVGPDPSDAKLGDHRISFEKVDPTEVSLVSALKKETFEPFTTSNGENVERLYVGTYSAEEVMQKLFTENAIMAWMLRLGGLVLCVVGFSLMLGPIKALVGWIPILGDVAGFALFMAAALMGMAVSLTTIAISWLAVRPLLAIVLLALVGAACFALWKLRSSAEEEAPVVDAAMFVD